MPSIETAPARCAGEPSDCSMRDGKGNRAEKGQFTMGHGINSKRDFQAGTTMAWHQLTRLLKVIGRDVFPEIVSVPLLYTVGDQLKEWEGVTVPISADDGLPVGVSSEESYTVFQPRAAFDFVAETLAGTRFTVESAGMIFNRSRWFLSVHLDELKDVAPEGQQFNLVWSGGLAHNQRPMCVLTAYRAVCANTVAMGREEGKALFAARCTKGFNAKLEGSRAEIESTVGMARIFAATLAGLDTIPATVDKARQVYAGELAEAGADLASTRSRNTLDDMVTLFRSGAGNDGDDRGDVLNGFTEYFGRGIAGGTKDKFSRWASSEFGASAERKAGFLLDIAGSGWDRLEAVGKAALADARKATVTV